MIIEWRRILFDYLKLAWISDILMGFSNGILLELIENSINPT